MKSDERVERWLDDLARFLDRTEEIVARGHAAFEADEIERLALEALSTRVGEISKRLVAADPDRFGGRVWSEAARFRDFLTHHYERIDQELMWDVVSRSFPELAAAAQAARH